MQYAYKYGTEVEDKETLRLKLILGLNPENDLVVSFSKAQGNFFYYKKLLA